MLYVPRRFYQLDWYVAPYDNNKISLHLTCSAEYFLFCEMLLQRPINMRELGLSNILSREETAYMREMASQRFESIMKVLKSMPRPMLLVFRNINTVRSINITLGAPVDRYFAMAKRSVQPQVTLWSLFGEWGAVNGQINHSSYNTLFPGLNVCYSSLDFIL